MERLDTEVFLEELDDLLNEGIGMVGAGHPAEYEIRRALGEQVRAYTMARMRKLLRGPPGSRQQYVNLPDAADGWHRDEWPNVERDREEWDR